DGIRDATVTGVQTCALPISSGERAAIGTEHRGVHAVGMARHGFSEGAGVCWVGDVPQPNGSIIAAGGEDTAIRAERRGAAGCGRSEERRVVREWVAGVVERA